MILKEKNFRDSMKVAKTELKNSTDTIVAENNGGEISKKTETKEQEER